MRKITIDEWKELCSGIGIREEASPDASNDYKQGYCKAVKAVLLDILNEMELSENEYEQYQEIVTDSVNSVKDLFQNNIIQLY